MATAERVVEFNTEMWFRNPNGYVKEVAEVGELLLTWDYGLIKKTRLDPVKTCELYFGKEKPWRAIIVAEWGAAEYRPGDMFGKPSAVYPVFSYGDSQTILEEMLAVPWASDPQALANERDQPLDYVPVAGQEHRVLITNLPNMQEARARGFLKFLAGKQQDYPQCIMHLHGLTTFRPMFAYPFRAVDFEARTPAQGGRVALPNGTTVPYERSANSPQWLKLMNVTVGDLAVPRNRCMFNIRSASWAAKYFRESMRFRVARVVTSGGAYPGFGNEEAADQEEGKDDLAIMIRAKEAELRRKVEAGEISAPPGFKFSAQSKANPTPVDITSSENDFKPMVAKSHLTRHQAYAPGDRITCNSCSVANICKVYREGSVCSVPRSPGEKLAKAFSSRDSGQIIDGLGSLVAMQAERLGDAMEEEKDFGELNPEVTKMMNSVFANGSKLAKLIDPTLNGAGTTVNVGVGAGGAAQVTTGNPNTIMAQVVRALEEKGIPRSEITPEMVAGILQAMNGGGSVSRAEVPMIEGVVVSESDES